MTLVTIDPGLDDTSVAVWQWPTRPASLQALAPLLLEVATWRTRPSAAVMLRLTRIGEALRALCARVRPGLVVIEQPAYTGIYRRMGGRTAAGGDRINAGGLAREREVAGVLVGVCIAVGVPWDWHAPSSVKVRDRPARLKLLGLLPKASNPDQRAALLLGVAVLTDARRKWAPLDTPGNG